MMAEEVNTVQEGVEELEKEITCAICHGHYTDPKVLPCCHYYCRECILKLVQKTGIDKPFSCPECRKDTTLPQGGVDRLQTAFFVNRMKELHSKLEQAHGTVEAKCEMCSGAKTEAFCRQCTMFICAECVRQHRRMKVFSAHKTTSLDELREGGARKIVMQDTIERCKEHEERMILYCYNCSCLICLHCTIKDHNGHSYEFIKKAAPEMKKELAKRLEPLKEMKNKMSFAVDKIQVVRSDIEAHAVSMTGEIEVSFEELFDILKKRKQAVLKEIATKVTQKLECLSKQEKSLMTEYAVVQSVIEYTDQCINHFADGEIMCMHSEIESRIASEIEECNSEERSLEPVEEMDLKVEVNCADDLKQLCETKAVITNKHDIVLEGVKTIKIHEKSEFSLTTKSGRKLECLLKSLIDGNIIKCEVNQKSANKFSVQFTPTVRGKHELVTLNGQEVVGDPLPVFVSVHPSQLRVPIRVIPEINSPYGIAVNSVGEIIVTKRKEVIMVDKEGKELRSVTSPDFSDLTGVAVDENDNMYIASFGNGKLFKFSPDMNLMKEVSTNRSSSLRGVSVVGNEVMVCYSSKGLVAVYTKELDYVREFSSSGNRDISSDKEGNLYISDNDNSRIQVYTRGGGGLLRSFICDVGPRGLFVKDEHVYVLCGSNKLSIYTTEGTYVTSIGSGYFSNPWGVCVDKDCFVYTCSYDNKILVF